MGFRGVQEVAERCRDCERDATARCVRCDVPVCEVHRPAADRRCARCEEAYAARPPLGMGFVFVLVVQVLAVGAAYALHLLAGVDIRIAIGGAAVLALGASFADRPLRQRWRRRGFLGERERSTGAPADATQVVHLPAWRSARRRFGRLAFAWWFVSMLASIIGAAAFDNLAIGPIATTTVFVMLAAWTAYAYAAPSRRRSVWFHDGRMWISDGRNQVRLSTTLDRFRPELGLYGLVRSKTTQTWHRVLRFAGDGLSPFSAYSSAVKLRPPEEESKTTGLPTFDVDAAQWAILTQQLGIED